MIKYYKNGFKLMDMRIMKAIIAKLKRYCSWIVVLLLSTASVSANELMSVEYSALSSEKTKIKLIFSEQIMKPNVFSTKEPARIIIDLEGVKNRLAERTEQINLGTTKSLTAIEVGERTRIVVNLLSTSQYNIDQQGNELTLLVGGAKIASEMSNNDVATISNVDFRRGENGEAKIIISLDSESTAMDVHQERGNLVVDIVNAKLPQELNRRLDVVDFGTPVKFIEMLIIE
jgi:type IV pilus assembly protein PilQ